MSDMTVLETGVIVGPVAGEIIGVKKLAQQLLEQSREQGIGLVGAGGLLSGLTKTVLEAGLGAELAEHLGHEYGERPMGRTCATACGPRRC